MSSDRWLQTRAEQIPDRIALASGDGRALTYAELEAAAAAGARELASEGAGPGDAVAISMPPGLEYAIRIHAISKAGAVASPVDPRLSADEVPAEHTASAGPGGSGLNSLHCRILTSGTTGTPRSIGLTHGNVLWSALGPGLRLGIEPEDRWLCCLPMFHVSGLMIVMRSLVYGTAAEIHEGFDLDRVAERLESEEVTLLSLVETQLSRLLDAGADINKPRAIVTGGGPVGEALLEEATGRGAQVVQTYGMTETTSQIATLSPAEARRKLGSAGQALLNAEIRIEDEEPGGEEGEILVRGPVVAPGSAAEDGWLHTADLGRIDDEGFLFVTGRRSELIISGGENVMPLEVEGVLSRHPAVADAAVVGRADPEWGEAVTALVVLADSAKAGEKTAEELRAHCAASLASFKVPKRFEFTDRLPRSAVGGKLLRNELRRDG